MITKYYKCRFLSDIVLVASSNTQGNVLLNDFVPGSNFLGIVAKNYDELSDNFEIFHSGDVSFGDAHISVDGGVSYKVPLSYHYVKNREGEYYNRILLSDDEEKSLRENHKQLKQKRDGYLTLDKKLLFLKHNYTQKSSYDKEKGRSRDSGMYGYSALEKGSEWIFKIDFSKEKYIEEIEKRLLGKKLLGKSKSAQYGRVEIEKIDTPKTISSFNPNNNLTYIYLNSRAILFDEGGNLTTTPTIENLGLKSGEIDWSKTYIKISTFNPYNYKRETKEYSRVCIEKGSVIAIKDLKGDLPYKIGGFVSEGFGDILVNPEFLKEKSFSLEKHNKKKNSIQIGNYDKDLIKFLNYKKEVEDSKFEVSQKVQEVYKKFLDNNKPISKSQWGQIRSIASIAKDENDLISKIEEFTEKGVSEKQWQDKRELLIAEIENSSNPIEFTKLLAMIVSKHTKGGRNG